MKTYLNSILGCRFVLSCLLAVLGLGAVGCTSVQHIEFNPGTTAIQKHPIRVALVLGKEFCAFEYRRDPGYIYPVGKYLCPCATYTANQAFAKVTEYDSLEEALKSPDADAVLIPKVVKLEFRSAGVAWDTRHTLVVLEWTLKNIKDQKTLWLATVEGRANGYVGSMFTMDGNDRVCMQQAMDDLNLKSIEAFNQSEEIRNFAQTLAR